MRTGYVVNGQIKPGRTEEAIAQAHEAMKLFERLGADEVSYRFGGGGTENGSTTFKFEAPSQADMGAFLDRMNGDSDYMSLMSRLNTEHSPSTLGLIIGFNVLDVGLPAGKAGRVGTLVAWQPRPGRTEEAIGLAVKAGKALLKLGASRCRVVQVTTGERIPTFISVTESESFTAQGQWREALQTDSTWQKIGAQLAAPDAPGVYLRFSEWYSPI